MTDMVVLTCNVLKIRLLYDDFARTLKRPFFSARTRTLGQKVREIVVNVKIASKVLYV